MFCKPESCTEEHCPLIERIEKILTGTDAEEPAATLCARLDIMQVLIEVGFRV